MNCGVGYFNSKNPILKAIPFDEKHAFIRDIRRLQGYVKRLTVAKSFPNDGTDLIVATMTERLPL